MRNDQGWRLLYLDQRRQDVLRDDPVLLRHDDEDDGVWLHLLHVHEQHPSLLLLKLPDDRLLRWILADRRSSFPFSDPIVLLALLFIRRGPDLPGGETSFSD